MTGKIERIVIVGAGQAASQAVVSLRRHGFAGRIVMLGDEGHLPYHRPPLSKAYLAGDVGIERLPIRAQQFYDDRDVDLRLRALAVSIDRDDRCVLTATGTKIAYDRLLIATGGRARELELAQGELPSKVFSVRKTADVDGIRRALVDRARVVIIGGGYIGLETASVLSGMGCRVCVLEAMDRVLARVAPPVIADFFAREHSRRGVEIATGVQVDAIVEEDGLTVVRAGADRWTADLVLVSIGLVSNLELAREAGLDCDVGVLVDEHCRTSDPAIYAAGDVAARRQDGGAGQRIESVQNAIWQGKAAAAAMLGAEPVAPEVPWFWSDQYDIKLQIAGLAGEDDDWVVRGDPTQAGFCVFSLRRGVLTSAICVNAPREFMKSKKYIREGAAVDAERLADIGADL